MITNTNCFFFGSVPYTAASTGPRTIPLWPKENKHTTTTTTTTTNHSSDHFLCCAAVPLFVVVCCVVFCHFMFILWFIYFYYSVLPCDLMCCSVLRCVVLFVSKLLCSWQMLCLVRFVLILSSFFKVLSWKCDIIQHRTQWRSPRRHSEVYQWSWASGNKK